MRRAFMALCASHHHLVLHGGIPEDHPQTGNQRLVHLEEASPVHPAEHHQGGPQTLHSLHHLLLILLVVSSRLLTDCCGLLQGFCVFRDLLLQLGDLAHQGAVARTAALSLSPKLCGFCLRLRNGLRLLLLVGLAPAHCLVVRLSLLVCLRLELRFHLAQQLEHPLDGAGLDLGTLGRGCSLDRADPCRLQLVARMLARYRQTTSAVSQGAC
mmetsp:Transcript_60269/g.194067  ORF Transcript_60269/g.194067 Transcript_60269/m.194067 type:complete len:212 (+) Transcript_60269:1874-2509(+)